MACSGRRVWTGSSGHRLTRSGRFSDGFRDGLDAAHSRELLQVGRLRARRQLELVRQWRVAEL
jgi:hypothetical protein